MTYPYCAYLCALINILPLFFIEGKQDIEVLSSIGMNVC